MRSEVNFIGISDDADVDLLSRTKALLSDHLLQNATPQVIGSLYSELGQIYLRIRNYPLAHQAWEKAIGYFKNVPERIHLAEAYYQYGLLLAQERDFDSSKNKLSQALQALGEVCQEEIGLQCQIILLLGQNLIELGDLSGAKEVFYRGLKKAQNSDHTLYQARLLQNLARIYVKSLKYEKALEMYLIALRLWKKANDQVQMGMLMNELGELYLQRSEYIKAMSSFKYSLKIQKKYKIENRISTLLQLGWLYLRFDPEKGIGFVQEANELLLCQLGYRFNEKQERELAQVLYLLGIYCREKSDRKTMMMFFRQSMKIFQKYRMEREWNEVYQIYMKYSPVEQRQYFNETGELVNKLAKHEKLRVSKYIG